MLAQLLTRTWWVFLIRGIFAIVFGVLAYFQSGTTLAALVLLFGAYSLADGVLSVFSAIGGRTEIDHWWLVLLEGLVGIGVGLVTLLVPGVTTIALLFYIAVRSIATGIVQIVAALRIRKEIEGEWLLIAAGLVSVLFGALLLAQPAAGALAVLWLIATFAIALGIVLVLLAFKARGFARRLKAAHA
jgi:uncharacterized membrane protein HdeD (DUF308 family)